jgi:predicted GNAT family acetyltransferase
MAGLVRDNGLVSFSNRGIFFGCRGQRSELEGVALIGQKTLVETSSPDAVETFGGFLPDIGMAHLIRGERTQVGQLLEYYKVANRQPRLVRSEILLEQRRAVRGVTAEPNLRVANAEDLDNVASINANLAIAETGVDPMTRDPKGMLARTARRIAQGRVWLLTDDGETIFKADIISDTPQAIFLEGVYVRLEARRKGHGLRCLTQLARNVLTRTNTISLVVNQENKRAQAFYAKVGFEFSSHYNTAYFPGL